ncbi:Tn7-like element transposition protein TnsE [Anaerosinus sp.]|uniref:Tn7-like element transposition protein TnsE n=1 Tax=Selenobaculum sp. TaxID=3074374 RepID=UPI003AB90C11
MPKKKIGFDSWPFKKGERVKLIKISKPYSYNGLWYLKAIYLSIATHQAKFVEHFFGDLHLLVLEAEYIDGIRQNMPKWETVDIKIFNNLLSDKKIEARLVTNGKYNEFDYYTFGASGKNGYYIIPLFEMLRAILAPDVFWLNQIPTLDSIDTRIICSQFGATLNLNFSTDVPVRYVSMDAKIKHIAWIFTNMEIHNMFQKLYHNIQAGKGVLFDFLFNELVIKANIEKWNGRNYVREIIECKEKRLNCNEIIVQHPNLVEYTKNQNNDSNEELKRKRRIPIGKNGLNKTLVSNMTAAQGFIDVESEDSIYSEYSSFAKIKRIRTSRLSKCNLSEQNGKVPGTNKRTTADFGGVDTVPQMEFQHSISEKLKGDFADIYAILSLMEDRKEVASIKYHVGRLEDHFKFRAICTLADKITPRKYLVGMILLKNGKQASVIEIQKDGISLTTLMLISSNDQKWKLICHKILKGLIEKSGSWTDVENEFDKLEVHRFKHTSAEIKIREKKMLDVINID